MAALNDWDVVDANNNATPPDGWPENTMQYSEVNDTGRAVQGTVRRFWGDSNGSLDAGGVANAYTLTLNESYSVYFDGMWFACQIPASNTGASTINVNGIGAQAIKARDGSDLTSGTLDAGGIYEFRYDGVNFQLMGTLGSEVGVGQATLTNSNAVDLVDTDVALRTGAVDPDSAQHLEMTLSELQSKSDATTAAGLDLNPVGGNVNVGAQSGSGVVDLYANGNPILETNNFGIKLSGVTGNSTGVDAAADTGQAAIFLARNADQGGASYKVNATTGAMEIFQTDTAGNEEELWIAGNRDGSVELYWNGNLRFQSSVGGATLEGELIVNQGAFDAGIDLNRGGQDWDIYIDGSGLLTVRDGSNLEVLMTLTPNGGTNFFINTADAFRVVANEARLYSTAVNGFYSWYNSSGTRTAFMQSATAQLGIINEIDGSAIAMQANDTGGTGRLILFGDPDTNTALYDQGVSVARTAAAASGGFEVNNQLTGGGFERVLTTGDLGVNPTKKVMDGYVITDQSKTDTGLATLLNGFTFQARSNSSGDRFRGKATLFVNNDSIAGTNPGLRLRFNSTAVEGTANNNGRLLSSRSAGVQSLDGRIDTTITGVDVDTVAGGRSWVDWEFGFLSLTNSTVFTMQWAQNVSNAAATNILVGSHMQVFDYGS